MDTITCQYSCTLCGLTDVEVEVPIREKSQNIVEWMKNICIPATVVDHARLMPDCHPTELHDLKIPVPAGSPMVGRPVEH